MKLALISDIHANLEALEAVLADIKKERADSVHCLGDVVGYGCDPVACLDLIEKECETKLIGNHEFAALGLTTIDKMNQFARKSMEWTISQLTDRDRSIIADYEMEAIVSGCHLTHASPYEPDKWHYLLDETNADISFEHLKEKIGFVGHTHLPMILSQWTDGSIRCKAGHDFDPDEESKYIVNIGSVGQPRDNDIRASYVLYDTEEEAILFRRVEYDIKKTQNKMSQAEMPEMLIERLGFGR